MLPEDVRAFASVVVHGEAPRGHLDDLVLTGGGVARGEAEGRYHLWGKSLFINSQTRPLHANEGNQRTNISGPRVPS